MSETRPSAVDARHNGRDGHDGEAAGAGRAAAGDDLPAAGTSGGPGGTGGQRFWLPTGLVAAIAFGICSVNAFTVLRDYERLGRPLAPWKAFAFEYSSWLLILALAPLVWLLLQRLPLGNRRWPRDLALHALATLPFSAVHIAGMVAVRKLVFSLADESYGGTEFFYEYRKDVLAYAGILAGYWVAARLVAAARAPAVAAPSPPAILTLRDGTRTLQVRIADLLWAASAGNYVEFALTDGRKPLIRGTLQHFEAALGPHGVVRVHRTRLVNPAHIAAIDSKESGDFTLTLDDGSQLAGSRRYRERLRAFT